MHRRISLHRDRDMKFSCFCALYIISVGSIWLVKAVPAHIWPDLAGGMFLRTGHVSSNTDAATWTSYLLLIENEVAYLGASPFSSNALGNLGHIFTNWICDSPTWSQHIEGRYANMPHQIWAKAHYKSKAPFNRFVLMVCHTKMGLNWPHLGHVAAIHLPSLQTSGEIPAPTIGITMLVLTIMNLVRSSRGWIHL